MNTDCEHKWVRLIDTEPGWVVDICIVCHIERGSYNGSNDGL